MTKKSKVIAIAANKGGVGKSTTAGAILANLSQRGYYSAGLSLDSQGDVETIFNAKIPETFPSIVEQMKDCSAWKGYTIDSRFPTRIIPADQGIELLPAALKQESVDFAERFILKSNSTHWEDLDYLIIDCPPSLNVFTRAALMAADWVIIPMWPVPLDIKGTCATMEYANAIARSQGQNSKIAGILFTLDEHLKVNEQTKESVASYFPGLPFHQTIRKTVMMEESIGRGLFHPLSRNMAVKDYDAFVTELLNRIK